MAPLMRIQLSQNDWLETGQTEQPSDLKILNLDASKYRFENKNLSISTQEALCLVMGCVFDVNLKVVG